MQLWSWKKPGSRRSTTCCTALRAIWTKGITGIPTTAGASKACPGHKHKFTHESVNQETVLIVPMLHVGTAQLWSAATRRPLIKAQTCLRTPYQKPENTS